MRIAICEDNREHLEILEEMVNRWAKTNNEQVVIGRYQSAEQFLFCMKDEPHYDLAFLDIQMAKISGLQLARMIREEDRLIFLVFTTALKQYAPKGYEVSAFRYLIKPLQEEEVFQALTNAGSMIEDRKREAVIITQGDDSRRIFKDDIYYIEVENHHIILHLKEETIRFKAKLKEFETQFREPQFCKCHRSYIVNLKYTGKISREGVEMEGKEVLPISKSRWEALNHCYMEYYMA
ncbi:MAG: LytTR family DNA-binding domain-containing protein [Acetatifactor sp.]|nr:LytTR family DNA-binding domain-containing protein [Acetatifactor sp.]